MTELKKTIIERHTTRKFLPRPVPRQVLDEALALAQHAPSNSNIQPWRVSIVSGAARERLKDALLEVAQKDEPSIPALPEAFRQYRHDLGMQVYGVGMGISREDKASRKAAILRNYEFYGAPVVAIVCMHKDLGHADFLSVGMYLQTLVLALTEQGLDTCVEVSLAEYPETIRKELGIGSEMLVLCGLAIGYGDLTFAGNQIRIGRVAVESCVAFVET